MSEIQEQQHTIDLREENEESNDQNWGNEEFNNYHENRIENFEIQEQEHAIDIREGNEESNNENCDNEEVNNNIYDEEYSTNYIGTGRNLFRKYTPLCQEIIRGDLQAVKHFLEHQPEAATTELDVNGFTALHLASFHGHVDIVRQLLPHMSSEDVLKKEASRGDTALMLVARNGNVEIAKYLVKKNAGSLEMPIKQSQWLKQQIIPVVVAAMSYQYQMTRYLYSVTPPKLLLRNNGDQASMLLRYLIVNRMLDIALDLVMKYPSPLGATAVFMLPCRPTLFPSGCKLGFLKRYIYSRIKIEISSFSANSPRKDPNLLGSVTSYLLKLFGLDKLSELKWTHVYSKEILHRMCEQIQTLDSEQRKQYRVYDAVFEGVTHGMEEFIVEIMRANPDLLAIQEQDTKKNIFHLAIECRQEKIFNLLYGVGHMKDIFTNLTDNDGNSLLHMAGLLSPLAKTKLEAIPGAGLQMQRERQWFKEVENIMPDMAREKLNIPKKALEDSSRRLTQVVRLQQMPSEVFSSSHAELLKAAEQWMKGTATSYIITAALIVTFVFAAAFTAPGGTHENNGLPIRIKDTKFMVFIVSDIISFFAASSSLLIFLGILTSRYTEDDFLVALPSKMIAGQSMLFVSIAAMVVAFSSAIFTVIKQSWIVMPVISLASLPVVLFVVLQYPLLREMIVFTFGRGIFDKSRKSWL